MNAPALLRGPLLMLPRLGAPRRRRLVLVAAGGLVLAALAAALLAGWPASTRPAAPARAESPALAAARARAMRARAAVPAPSAREAERTAAPSRVAASSWVADLFASHSWYVAPPPPPPQVVNTTPPPPTAPPFPYTFLGSYAPDGGQPVYFMSRQDRVVDARIGDRLDGVYEFESADATQLVFNYLPLNIRQSVPTGVSP